MKDIFVKSAMTVVADNWREGMSVEEELLCTADKSLYATLLYRTSRQVGQRTRLALACAKELMYVDEGYASGVFLGVGAGDMSREIIEPIIGLSASDAKSALPPLYLLGVLPNTPASRIAIELSLKGQCWTDTSGAASVMNAMWMAVSQLREGVIDCAVVGGCDYAGSAMLCLGTSQKKAVAKIKACDWSGINNVKRESIVSTAVSLVNSARSKSLWETTQSGRVVFE